MGEHACVNSYGRLLVSSSLLSCAIDARMAAIDDAAGLRRPSPRPAPRPTSSATIAATIGTQMGVPDAVVLLVLAGAVVFWFDAGVGVAAAAFALTVNVNEPDAGSPSSAETVFQKTT